MRNRTADILHRTHWPSIMDGEIDCSIPRYEPPAKIKRKKLKKVSKQQWNAVFSLKAKP